MTTLKQTGRTRRLWDAARPILWAIGIAFLVRIFVFQPFSIPSGSMRETLLVGDHLFVSKYIYGYSRYSFPVSLPFITGRVFGSIPQTGDIIVFKLPKNTSIDYIKRVIGRPGDRVQVKEGAVYINGTALPREAAGHFAPSGATRWREHLPDGKSWTTLDSTPNGSRDNTDVFLVPDNHLFVMGDNRDNSIDSRVQQSVGFVPVENVVGRAEIIYFSVTPDIRLWKIWAWPTHIRWSRLWQRTR